MQSSDEVKTEFLAKLRALLREYGAEISADDHYRGYPECGEDIRMTVDIPSIYVDGEYTREMTSINLGGYFTSDDDAILRDAQEKARAL